MSSGETQFGAWLRRKLVERHLSLAQLCRAAGCDYTYLWRIVHADAARGRRFSRPSYSLTKRLGDVLEAPREALAAAGYDPADLADARTADRLARLERDVASLRASVDAASPDDWHVVRLPLVGHVQAGSLHEAIENPDDWTVLPEFVAHGADFALKVRGDSMSPTLLEGDIVTVRKQVTAEPGQLVVATLEGEVTLKRFDVVDGIPTLVADNPEWKAVRCGPRVSLVGVVTGSFRPSDVLLRRPR